MSGSESNINLIYIWIGTINTWFMLIPIFIGLRKKNELNKELKIFLWFCICTFLINIFEQGFIRIVGNNKEFFIPILEHWKISDTSFLQIFAYIKNYVFLGFFYYLLFPRKFRQAIKLLSYFLIFYSLVNYLFIEGYNVIGIYNPTINVIFKFVLPALYLYFVFKNMLYFPLRKNPYFWISFGLVFINLIALFLYLIGDSIYGDDFVLFAKISIARNFFDMISLVLISIGFWYAPYAKYISLPEEKTANKIPPQKYYK